MRSRLAPGGKHPRGQETTMKTPSFPDHLGLDVPILFLGVHFIRSVAAHCMIRVQGIVCGSGAPRNSARRQQRGPLKRTCAAAATSSVVGLTRCANTHITHYKWNFLTALYL
jgi:hypothetical protein